MDRGTPPVRRPVQRLTPRRQRQRVHLHVSFLKTRGVPGLRWVTCTHRWRSLVEFHPESLVALAAYLHNLREEAARLLATVALEGH